MLRPTRLTGMPLFLGARTIAHKVQSEMRKMEAASFTVKNSG